MTLHIIDWCVDLWYRVAKVEQSQTFCRAPLHLSATPCCQRRCLIEMNKGAVFYYAVLMSVRMWPKRFCGSLTMSHDVHLCSWPTRVTIHAATRGPHQVNINIGRCRHLKNRPMVSFFFLHKPLNWFLLVFALSRIIKHLHVQLWKTLWTN